MPRRSGGHETLGRIGVHCRRGRAGRISEGLSSRSKVGRSESSREHLLHPERCGFAFLIVEFMATGFAFRMAERME